MDQSEQIFHKELEADLIRLAAEVGRSREMPEMKSLPDRDIVKHALANMTGTRPISLSVPDKSSRPLPAYMSDASPETKLEVEYLVDMAFHKGIMDAAKEAHASKNPFIEDAFHDALAGKLYDEMERRGMMK